LITGWFKITELCAMIADPAKSVRLDYVELVIGFSWLELLGELQRALNQEEASQDI